MVDRAAEWSFRSVLICVSDLERSVDFYRDVMSIGEVMREDQVAVLGRDEIGTFTVFLRQALRGAAHPGQQALGLRMLSCTVGSFGELDRVEERLRAHGALRDRQALGEPGELEMVRGYDPDRLPLVFVAHQTGKTMSADDYHRAMSQMYVVDV